MLFHIAHQTRYRYSQPVYPVPHEIRLRPRCDWSQRLVDFALDIDPAPAGIAYNLDAEGNAATRVWFEGRHPQFCVALRTTVETLRVNPFEFLLEASFDELSAGYGEARTAVLAPYLLRGDTSEPVVELGGELARQAGGQVLPFLKGLNAYIYQSHQAEIRLEGGPLAAEETHDVVRDMPRALILGIITLLALSLFTMVLNSGVGEGAAAIGSSGAPLSDGFKAVFGEGLNSFLINSKKRLSKKHFFYE